MVAWPWGTRLLLPPYRSALKQGPFVGARTKRRGTRRGTPETSYFLSLSTERGTEGATQHYRRHDQRQTEAEGTTRLAGGG
ncbi:hypothetical protein E2C01_036121 [Portunus trituberculatus]|uniref:Uncharacterized protein n=1 Tax=Portunus trituberculatus TaxID=210409 RepID=A0A5B7FB66_PORTR|nr:hypothetical protein [Portunus trituberculatus]